MHAVAVTNDPSPRTARVVRVEVRVRRGSPGPPSVRRFSFVRSVDSGVGFSSFFFALVNFYSEREVSCLAVVRTLPAPGDSINGNDDRMGG